VWSFTGLVRGITPGKVLLLLQGGAGLNQQ
jgi:hypothetical protein